MTKGGPDEPRVGAAFSNLVSLHWPHIPYLHVWLMVIVLVSAGLLYYLDFILPIDEHNSLVHITGYMDRVLWLVPVVFGTIIFRRKGGLLVLGIAVAAMLPRDILASSNLAQALTETASIVLVSSIIIIWSVEPQREVKRSEEVMAMLEIARKELGAHIEMITRHERQLSAIHEVCQFITSSLDLPFVLQRTLARTAEVMDVPVAMMFLKDKSGKTLELVAHTGISERFASAVGRMPIGDGFNGRVALSGESMAVVNSMDDPRLCIAQVKEEGIQSQLIVPLRCKGLTIGTLCVAVRNSRRFTPQDMELLTALGGQVGVAIENARLYQDALASQEKYRDLFEKATAAIFVHDLNGVITDANKACVELTGYRLADLINMDVGKLFTQSALRKLGEIEQMVLKGESAAEAYEVKMVRKDNTERTLSMTTRLIMDNGKPTSFQHIAQDITEQRRMRETLDDYIRRVLTAQEEERKRIARELHDETAQSLLLISQRLDALTSDSKNSLKHETKLSLENARELVIDTLNGLRRLTQDLRPRILDDLGLSAALEWLADELEKQAGLKVKVVVTNRSRPLRFEAQLLLFRIAQEALSNVRRHAEASEVGIALEPEENSVRLIIQDNGKGFQVPPKLTDLAMSGKLGILGMQERAKLLGGTVAVHSQPGQGTEVVAELPI